MHSEVNLACCCRKLYSRDTEESTRQEKGSDGSNFEEIQEKSEQPQEWLTSQKLNQVGNISEVS